MRSESTRHRELIISGIRRKETSNKQDDVLPLWILYGLCCVRMFDGALMTVRAPFRLGIEGIEHA